MRRMELAFEIRDVHGEGVLVIVVVVVEVAAVEEEMVVEDEGFVGEKVVEVMVGELVEVEEGGGESRGDGDGGVSGRDGGSGSAGYERGGGDREVKWIIFIATALWIISPSSSSSSSVVWGLGAGGEGGDGPVAEGGVVIAEGDGGGRYGKYLRANGVSAPNPPPPPTPLPLPSTDPPSPVTLSKVNGTSPCISSGWVCVVAALDRG